MMDIGIHFINDTQFSLSNKSDGISVVGRISQEEFEKFIKTYYIDVLEVVHKVERVSYDRRKEDRRGCW